LGISSTIIKKSKVLKLKIRIFATYIKKHKMSTIFTLFMILIIVACVLLMIVIMAQNPKGGGLSGTFGASNPAAFGVQRTNQFMDKATWTLASTVLILIVLAVSLTAKPLAEVPQAKKTEATQKPATEAAPVKK
jgi:preprotein translocase subunit SecG